MFTQVYLDLDDVLADLSAGFRGASGLPLNYNVQNSMGFDAYWATIDHARPGFWENLPLKSGATSLLVSVFQLFQPEAIHVLSAVLEHHPECEPGKRKWVQKHTGILPQNVNIVKRREKKKFAKGSKFPGGHLLIDDMEKNCREWEAAGGIALRYRDPDEAIKKLYTLVKCRGIHSL